MVFKIPSKRRWSNLYGVHDLRLNLGSGPTKGATPWINIDEFGADINWDLRRGIPVPDNSVSEIFSSHFLEHLDVQNLKFLSSEVYRVLKPGSKFLISVPDARKYIESYMTGSDYEERACWFKCDLIETGTPIDQLNYIAYMGGLHRQLFDFEGLRMFLLSCGFIEVVRRDADENLDSAKRAHHSLLISAMK